jgi:hypothetical protein
MGVQELFSSLIILALGALVLLACRVAAKLWRWAAPPSASAMSRPAVPPAYPGPEHQPQRTRGLPDNFVTHWPLRNAPAP